MSVYESIVRGLNDAIEYEKGNNGKARVTEISDEHYDRVMAEKKPRVSVADVPDFTAEEIKQLRQTLKMTQSTFAALMGVSVKTIEAWESGTNVPLGTARRMLGLLRSDNSIPTKYNLVG